VLALIKTGAVYPVASNANSLVYYADLGSVTGNPSPGGGIKQGTILPPHYGVLPDVVAKG
jgi:hypothetical protein